MIELFGSEYARKSTLARVSKAGPVQPLSFCAFRYGSIRVVSYGRLRQDGFTNPRGPLSYQFPRNFSEPVREKARERCS